MMPDSRGGGFATLLPGSGLEGIEADEQIKTGKFSFACHCGTVKFETDIHIRFSSCACKSDTRVANGLLWTGASLPARSSDGAAIMYKGDEANLPTDTVVKDGHRSFCPTCASYVAFDPEDGEVTLVSLANLTDFRRFRPEKPSDCIHLLDQRGLVLQDGAEDGGLVGILKHHVRRSSDGSADAARIRTRDTLISARRSGSRRARASRATRRRRPTRASRRASASAAADLSSHAASSPRVRRHPVHSTGRTARTGCGADGDDQANRRHAAETRRSEVQS